MNFLIAKTIKRSPLRQHELSFSWFTWWLLLIKLRSRGQCKTRESGAFLLGSRCSDGQAKIVDFVMYDDLDPHSLDSGIVRFDGRYFGDLWDLCRRKKLRVIADVHVHPGSSLQSASDRQHPMISRPGHLALILPYFARLPIRKSEIGVYRYLGGKQWESIPHRQRQHFIKIEFL